MEWNIFVKSGLFYFVNVFVFQWKVLGSFLVVEEFLDLKVGRYGLGREYPFYDVTISPV